MKVRDLTGMGIKNLWRRKTRTILTVLGVVIGSSAILLMISLGLGQERAFQKSLEMFGNIRIIEVDANGGMPMEAGTSDGQKEKPVLNVKTVAEVKALEGVKAVLAMYSGYVELQAGRYQGGAQVMGVDLSVLESFTYTVDQGRMPAPTEKNTLVVGSAFSTSFYDHKARIWTPITIDPLTAKFKGYVNGMFDTKGNKKRGIPFNVAGVLKATGSNDYMVFMDEKQLLKLLADEERKNPPADKKQRGKVKNYERLQVLCDSIEDVERVHEALKEMGFNAYSPIEYVKYEKQKMQTQQMVLGGIGAVSLLIAAIGITNTMIMAIYERTKEIGVMKVLGAEVKDIMRLFLFEAAIIGLLGGLVGIGISLVGSDIINHVNASMQQDMAANLGYDPSNGMLEISYIPLWLIVLSLVFSTLIGVISGFLPAIRATKLSALEAIRNE